MSASESGTGIAMLGWDLTQVNESAALCGSDPAGGSPSARSTLIQIAATHPARTALHCRARLACQWSIRCAYTRKLDRANVLPILCLRKDNLGPLAWWYG